MSAAPSRVLYIDDDAGIGRLVQKTLARHDFDVEIATSGDEGLQRLTHETFDVVALDHHMPGQTGLQVLALIRQLPVPPPVVYVTGSEDSHVAVAALKSGAVDYVWKDLQGHFRDLLAEALKTALEKERLRRANEAAEREVRAARDRAEMLLREVNHRIANSLTIVTSLVRLQRHRVEDVAVKEILDQVQARIAAVAAVHRRLYTSDDVSTVDLAEYLTSLLCDLGRSQSDAARSITIRLDCAPLSLATDKVVSFGIIVVELVTNAYKYAYADGEGGEIRVRVSVDDGKVVLVVEDDGRGLADGGPTGTGLGSRLVGLMATSVGGKVDIENANPGVRATLTFPL